MGPEVKGLPGYRDRVREPHVIAITPHQRARGGTMRPISAVNSFRILLALLIVGIAFPLDLAEADARNSWITINVKEMPDTLELGGRVSFDVTVQNSFRSSTRADIVLTVVNEDEELVRIKTWRNRHLPGRNRSIQLNDRYKLGSDNKTGIYTVSTFVLSGSSLRSILRGDFSGISDDQTATATFTVVADNGDIATSTPDPTHTPTTPPTPTPPPTSSPTPPPTVSPAPTVV